MRTCYSLVFSMMMSVGAVAVPGAEKTLYEFTSDVPAGLLETRQATAVRTERNTLKLTLDAVSGWPGITLKPSEGVWDLSPYAVFHVRILNTGSRSANIGIRVDNEGADGARNCLQHMQDIVAGQSYEFAFPIVRKGQMSVKMFGMRGYPVEVGGNTGGTMAVDPKAIIGVLVFTYNPEQPVEIEVERIWVDGVYHDASIGGKRFNEGNFFPCIDTYGQFKHREWPGKVKDAADLATRRGIEERDLAVHPGPADWNKWGGWEAGPSLNGTGYFRTAKYGGKWWLVDPDGKLFFSHGPDCVGEKNYTPIDDREHWFEDFAGNDPRFADCWRTQYHVVNGYYAGKQPRIFDVSTANIMRKYGEDWLSEYSAMTHRRLRSWGMNTIANWSDSRIYLDRKTPYFACLGTSGVSLAGSVGYWGKFKDVFDPRFAESIKRSIEGQRGKSVNDSWCIGYFVDNEISWGDETALAIGTLKSPATQVAKQVFIKDLREKYQDIASLNAVWGTSHVSWDALLSSCEAPEVSRAQQDLLAFNRKTAETYFKTIRDALKAVAPNQLYFGCRFAWVNSQVAEVASRYCDVVSYNLYRRDVSDFRCRSGRDVPTIIGEFHFGALDRGMFHTGLVGVIDQAARAKAYKHYVEGVLRNPQFVGCHWFKYMDEPCTGRALDGENYQIGFLDIVDTPYMETVNASREVGYGMYEYRLKKK